MEDLRIQIGVQLNELVEAISRPFSAAAASDGWSEASWAKWQLAFRRLRDSFVSGQSLPEASISRAMDFDGVTGGVLLEQAATLSNSLRHLRQIGGISA
jgi:hypothetical protein